MDETVYSTSGLARITAGPPATRLRLAGLVATALLGSILVIWVTRTTWQRVDRLQQEFSGLNAESFYLGVRMRGDIQRLNDTLLHYRLSGDKADYESFRTNVHNLTQWFEESRRHATGPHERQFFEQLGNSYSQYVLQSSNLLEAGVSWFRSKAGDFPASYKKVQDQSQGLLDLCDSFIADQRGSFTDFLAESNRTLTSFQRLLRLSLILVLTLAAALVALVYRGMIAPLRLQLNESQAVIVRQEKLASLGVLAAGVTHEIRNPLTAIKFRLYSLRKSLPAPDADNEDITVIANEISRLERIVQDFLQFARPSEPELVAVPPQRILQEVHNLLRPELDKAAIKFSFDGAETAWVRADTHQIKEVLINLVQNAAESIGRQGTVTLRARDKGNSVVIEVADTGKGIPPDVQKRLFDPFFTTKEGGTGLGLSIAARIVEKHGGQLHYHTQLNRGTTFSIVLPRAHDHET
jgi:signal transduction histidine kinase